jgi:hypothetical protein
MSGNESLQVFKLTGMSRNLPTIRSWSGELCDSHPGESGQCGCCTNAVCWCYGLQCSAKVGREERRLDCATWCWWRSKTFPFNLPHKSHSRLTLFFPQLGHIGVQIAARGMGMRVIGIDAGSKKDLVLESGAEHFINHEEGKAEDQVMALTSGLGAQAVLVLTAANAAYASAMGLLRYGGTLVVVGLPEGEMKPIATAFPSVMVAKALSIVGVAVGDRQDAVETLAMAERGVVKTHFRTAKMDELTGVFEEMHAQKLKGRVVLDLQ